MKCKRMLALLLTAALVLVTCTGAFAAPPEGEERKEETVYVIADASGTPSSILVSTWLQNPKGAGDALRPQQPVGSGGSEGQRHVLPGQRWRPSLAG